MEKEGNKEKSKSDSHKIESNKTDVHHESHESHGKKTLTEKIRENPWILSTLVLGVIALILLVGWNTGDFGGTISKDKAGELILNLAKAQVGEDVSLVGVNKTSGLYEVIILIQGKEVPVYVTLDGKNLVLGGLAPLEDIQNQNNPNTGNEQPKEVPKSAKPKVELFVMSFCPYGTQAEKGILPVVSLLGSKIDFKLRMVHYTLHGEKEDTENSRQLCIREEQGQDKLNKYLVCILNSTDPYAPADVGACEKKVGINSAKLNICLTAKAKTYFDADSTLSKGYGVQGSPTLVINGVQSDAGRSPSSYLKGICDSFTTLPSECNQVLSTSTPSAGFGYKTGSDTVAKC